jgi:hypothetical protein
VFRVLAALIVVGWLVLSAYLLFGPQRIWWAPLLMFATFVWPAVVYLLPRARPNNTHRDHIVFSTSLVDDEEENDREPLPAGRAALAELAKLIAQRGHAVGAITQGYFYAWTVDIDDCEALIQGDDAELLLIVHGRGFQAIVSTLVDVMTADARFSNVRALTAHELAQRDASRA